MGADASVLLDECRQFRSGCQPSWFSVSEPIHTILLNPYYLDKFEVTNEQFANFLNTFETHEGVCFGENCLTIEESRLQIENEAYLTSDEVKNHPVFGVTWFGAAAYCQWLGARLPTEAEWEMAASLDPSTNTKTLYPWGDEFDGSLVNFCDNQCQERQANSTVDDGFIIEAPVGSYEAGRSPLGLYDMGGNVWEWVLDWYDADYYENSPTANPTGPADGTERVVRGGSWFDTGNFTGTMLRFPSDPLEGMITIGFRCARDG